MDEVYAEWGPVFITTLDPAKLREALKLADALADAVEALTTLLDKRQAYLELAMDAIAD